MQCAKFVLEPFVLPTRVDWMPCFGRHNHDGTHISALRNKKISLFTAWGILVSIFSPVQEEGCSQISSNADAGVEIKGTLIEHRPLEVDLARTSVSNSNEPDLLQSSCPGVPKIEEVLAGFSLQTGIVIMRWESRVCVFVRHEK